MSVPSIQPSKSCHETAIAATIDPHCDEHVRSNRANDAVTQAILVAVVFVFIAVATHISIGMYERYGLGFDLAVFDQGAWLISRGHTPFITVRGMHLMADHFSAIMYLIAPLYRLWADPRLLLTIQCAAVGISAIPLYYIARHISKSSMIAFAWALAFLLNPSVQSVAVDEFHPDAIAMPLILTAFYCLQRRRLQCMIVALAFACITKESAALTVVFFGLYAFGAERRFGVFAFVTGVCGLTAAELTMHYFNHWQPSGYIALFRQFGESPQTVVWFLLCHPRILMSQLFGASMRVYLLRLFVPVMFLCLCAPDALFVSVPALLINALSSRPNMRSVSGHFTVMITPIVFVAAAVGFERVMRYGGRLHGGVLCVGLASCVFLTSASGPMISPASSIGGSFSEKSAHKTYEILQLIPPNASVSSEASVLPALSRRISIYSFPNPFITTHYGSSELAQLQLDGGDSRPCPASVFQQHISSSTIDYIALSASSSEATALSHECAVQAMLSPAYGIVGVGHNVILLRRGAPRRAGLTILFGTGGMIADNQGGIDAAYTLWSNVKRSGS